MVETLNPTEVLETPNQTTETVEEFDYSEFLNLKEPGAIYSAVKRAFDFCVATVAIIVLLIPLLVISLIIRATSKGSAIFVQKRVGKNGKVFKMYKFRTMHIETPKYLATAEIDDPDKYKTKMGKILRRFSLDELPQIINIFKGDMSLIGPRPLIPEETDVHEMRKKVGVYKLRPGMTGWAQVNGRDSVTPVQKARYDAMYLRDFGAKMDLKIFFITIKKVIGAIDVVEGKESLEQEC